MLATPEGGESAGPTANRFTGVVTIGRDLSTTFSIEKKKKKTSFGSFLCQTSDRFSNQRVHIRSLQLQSFRSNHREESEGREEGPQKFPSTGRRRRHHASLEDDYTK